MRKENRRFYRDCTPDFITILLQTLLRDYEKDGDMYILNLPDCIVGIKHKWLKKDDKKDT